MKASFPGVPMSIKQLDCICPPESWPRKGQFLCFLLPFLLDVVQGLSTLTLVLWAFSLLPASLPACGCLTTMWLTWLFLFSGLLLLAATEMYSLPGPEFFFETLIKLFLSFLLGLLLNSFINETRIPKRDVSTSPVIRSNHKGIELFRISGKDLSCHLEILQTLPWDQAPEEPHTVTPTAVEVPKSRSWTHLSSPASEIQGENEEEPVGRRLLWAQAEILRDFNTSLAPVLLVPSLGFVRLGTLTFTSPSLLHPRTVKDFFPSLHLAATPM